MNSVKKSHCCNSGDDVESGFHFYNGTFITPFSAEDFDLNLQDFNVTLGSNTVNVSWTHVHPCITEYHVELRKISDDSTFTSDDSLMGNAAITYTFQIQLPKNFHIQNGLSSYYVKFSFSEKAKKICAIVYLVNVKTIRRMAQIFVAFSEKLIFNHVLGFSDPPPLFCDYF